MSIDLGDGDDSPPEEVSRERAKELIGEAEAGTLIVASTAPVPTLGEVPDDEIAMDVSIDTYRFGSVEEFTLGGDPGDTDEDGGD